MMRNVKILFLVCLSFVFVIQQGSGQIKQLSINRIDSMPRHPTPYKLIDWKERAVNFDHSVFDWNSKGKYFPLIWIDSSSRNINQKTFGIYTVIGDVRQGPGHANGEFHEAVNSLGAIMSAGLIGIDKRNQDGYNYVKMVQNYFNSANHWNIVMNNTNPQVAHLGGGYGRDWWYDVFPNVLYYAVSDLFPKVSHSDFIQHSIAEQFCKADSVLNGNYDFSCFDYSQMKGIRNQIPLQQDVAAGHAYVLYAAYEKYKDPRYLKRAESSLNALLGQKESRFYEVLMPFGAYVAARLNAEQGTHYDVSKVLNWVFDGCKAADGRTGWGVITGRWGKYDVSGLQGSTTDGGGYAFLMNTLDMAWPLVPMVRYDPRYARAVGKWMLNASNAARLFYPYDISDSCQELPEKKAITKNVIAYEGLRRVDYYGKKELVGVSPVAMGDGPRWADGQPDVTVFSIYGSAHVGIYGSIIRKTNVEQILQLNCLSTDFYRNHAYPTYLYYNPYSTEKSIVFNNKGTAVDLYDVISDKILAYNVVKKGVFKIKSDEACLIVVIPAGSKLKKAQGKVMTHNTIISYVSSMN